WKTVVFAVNHQNPESTHGKIPQRHIAKAHIQIHKNNGIARIRNADSPRRTSTKRKNITHRQVTNCKIQQNKMNSAVRTDQKLRSHETRYCWIHTHEIKLNPRCARSCSSFCRSLHFLLCGYRFSGYLVIFLRGFLLICWWCKLAQTHPTRRLP